MGQDRRIILWIILMVIIGSASVCTAKWIGQHTGEEPEDLIVEYMGHIKEKDYAAMYAMTDPESSSDIGRERYIERHSKIYEGMEVGDVSLRGIVAGEPVSESGFLKVYIGGETKKSMPDIISDQASMASLENGSTR